MAAEDGSVKIKVNIDISDVNAGVKDIGAQMKKAGETVARTGKAMGKNLSKGWGYDQSAVDFMENFGKAMDGDAKAAAEVMKYYDQQGVSADEASKSVQKLAEEEAEAAAAAEAERAAATADADTAMQDAGGEAVAAEEQTTAWSRVRAVLAGVAERMGLVRRQTDDTSGAMTSLRSSAGAAASSVNSVFKKVLKWGLGIRSTFILVRRLRNAVKEGFTILAKHDTETADTLERLQNALTNVKVSLAAAFKPILTAVAPLLEKLADLAIRAANAVARFFAVLSGRGSYTRVVTGAASTISNAMGGVAVASVGAAANTRKMAANMNTAQIAASGTAEGVKAAAEAAEDAAQNLSGLDELNIWQENKSGGGGGGGAGDDLGFETEEVPVEPSDFLVRFKDILFEWENLNPELIAEKILTGLCMAAGGIIGYTLGGPVGGLVGLTMGALLGVKISELTFNGDGKLSKSEIVNLLWNALGLILGGVLGFMAGGPMGAVVGFTLAAALRVILSKVDFDKGSDAGGSKASGIFSEVLTGLIGGIVGGLGGAVGFALGGPVGALFGFTVGAWLGVKLSSAKLTDGMSLKDWVKEKIIGLVQKALDAYHAVVEFGAKVINDAATWWKNVKTWWGKKVGAVKEFTTNVANKAADWWSNVQTWWNGKVGAVKEFTTKVKNDAAAWWSNVKTWWSGKVGAVKNFTTSVANHAATWWGNVQNWWGAKVGAVKSFTTSVVNHAATWWGNVQNWWGGKVGAVKDFTTNVANHAATWWGNVKSWWGDKVGAVKNFTTAVSNTAGTWWSNVKSWWAEKSAGGVSFKAMVTSFTDAIRNKVLLNFQAKITSFVDAIQNKVLDFAAKIGSWFGFGSSSSSGSNKPGISGAGRKATGGIYTAGGWRPVEGYAGGGSPRSGRLFIANENGMPELVGQIGGHTAVMNNGQIVASVAAGVYQAVAAAASQVGGWFRAMSAELANIPPAIKMLAAMPAQTPLPVMATGTVLPPRAVYAADQASELKAAVRELRDALRLGGVGQDTPVVVNVALDGQVDGRNLFRAVQTQARIEKRTTGRDPFGG